MYVWKSEEAIEEEQDQDMENIKHIGNIGLGNIVLEEEQDPTQAQHTSQPSTIQRKRARASTS